MAVSKILRNFAKLFRRSAGEASKEKDIERFAIDKVVQELSRRAVHGDGREGGEASVNEKGKTGNPTAGPGG